MVRPSTTLKTFEASVARSMPTSSKAAARRLARLAYKNATVNSANKAEADKLLVSGMITAHDIMEKVIKGYPELEPCEIFLYGKCKSSERQK
jgi:hypothetical protein